MKKFSNIAFVILFLFFCIFIFLFNFIVNPYNLEQYSKHNFSIMHSPANLISTFLKQTKNIKYKYVVLGASSTFNIFSTDTFLCKTSEPIARLIVPGFSSEKQYELLTYFLDLHPEVEHVYVALENYAYLLCENFNDCKIKKTSDIEDFINLYFSIDSSLLSFNKVYNRLFPVKNINIVQENEDDSFFVYPNRKYIAYYNENCLKTNIDSLKKIKVLLDSKNINSVFFIPPAHSLFLGDLYLSGNLEYYEKLKRTYAQVVKFYDMAFVNELTTRPFDWCWQDVLHINSFSNMDIFNFLVDNDNSLNIAMEINLDNVNEVLDKQRKLISQYVEQNKLEVEAYNKLYYDETHPEKYAEKNYYKNIPSEYNIVNICPIDKVRLLETKLGL